MHAATCAARIERRLQFKCALVRQRPIRQRVVQRHTLGDSNAPAAGRETQISCEYANQLRGVFLVTLSQDVHNVTVDGCDARRSSRVSSGHAFWGRCGVRAPGVHICTPGVVQPCDGEHGSRPTMLQQCSCSAATCRYIKYSSCRRCSRAPCSGNLPARPAHIRGRRQQRHGSTQRCRRGGRNGHHTERCETHSCQRRNGWWRRRADQQP
jgi:hypothetical protein